jgi:hypothetical protein
MRTGTYNESTGRDENQIHCHGFSPDLVRQTLLTFLSRLISDWIKDVSASRFGSSSFRGEGLTSLLRSGKQRRILCLSEGISKLRQRCLANTARSANEDGGVPADRIEAIWSLHARMESRETVFFFL